MSSLLSRKFILCILTMILLIVTAFAAAYIPALAGLYPVLAGSLLGAAGLYFGANTLAAHVDNVGTTKKLAITNKAVTPEDILNRDS